MTITRKKWLLFFACIAIFHGALFVDFYHRAEFTFAVLWASQSALMLVNAYREYRVTWIIQKDDRIFTIKRNGKILFKGKKMDLFHYKLHFGSYIIKPFRGWAIHVPTEVTNDSLLELLSIKK